MRTRAYGKNLPAPELTPPNRCTRRLCRRWFYIDWDMCGSLVTRGRTFNPLCLLLGCQHPLTARKS